jgi:hypothetical protein
MLVTIAVTRSAVTRGRAGAPTWGDVTARDVVRGLCDFGTSASMLVRQRCARIGAAGTELERVTTQSDGGGADH